MAQLRQDHAQFVEREVEVVVLGPEDAGAFAAYFKKEDLPFTGLPDPKASVLKLYGQEVNLFKLGRMPAQVLIDRAGMARFVHYGHSMSD
ncbi:MAG: redoxin domain-containing protein, partial [Chloroflexota bacterium]